MMRRALPVLALSALAGCSFAPHDLRPELPVPPSWPVGDAYLRQSEGALPSVPYAQVFTDPRLQAIIGEALLNNRDLRIAAANIAAARAQYQIQRGELFPELDAGGSYTRSSGTRTVAGGPTGGTTFTNATASASVPAFEIDLFGRVRSLTRAAQDQYFAQEAAARQTRLVLVANVASAWLTYASDQSLLQIARDTAASATQTVRLTTARLNGGVAPRTDLTQAETVLATAQSDLAEQTTRVAQDANALQLLVGAPVDPALLPANLDQVVGTVRPIPTGLDSTVLLRRPDVVQAEYQLYAANADIGAARAALFPRITLGGLAGLTAPGIAGLFTSGVFENSISPSITYPIFRAGAGRANVRYSRAQRDAAVANYERSVQTAFREVSDALARSGTVGAELDAQRRNRDASAESFNLLSARYQGGIDPFLNSLVAQRTLYDAQRSYAQFQLVAVNNLVTQYEMLGGDATLDVAADGPRLATGQAPRQPGRNLITRP